MRLEQLKNPQESRKAHAACSGQWKLSSCPQVSKKNKRCQYCLCLSLREGVVLKGEHWGSRGVLIVPVGR